jgi:glycogen debranching enzyme
MSYHNGSVWPHDNALIALGMGPIHLRWHAAKILQMFMDASMYMEGYRLPELFCGFHRRAQEAPTRYPVACSPQAWASASVYMMLQACLGLSVVGRTHELVLHRPCLPEFLHQVTISGLRVSNAKLDILLHRHGDGVSVNVTKREGDVRVIMVT